MTYQAKKFISWSHSFGKMIKENETLMEYLPLFILQQDIRVKTLGELEFSDLPERESVPINFAEHVWRKTDGDIAREAANKKRGLR